MLPFPWEKAWGHVDRPLSWCYPQHIAWERDVTVNPSNWAGYRLSFPFLHSADSSVFYICGDTLTKQNCLSGYRTWFRVAGEVSVESSPISLFIVGDSGESIYFNRSISFVLNKWGDLTGKETSRLDSNTWHKFTEYYDGLNFESKLAFARKLFWIQVPGSSIISDSDSTRVRKAVIVGSNETGSGIFVQDRYPDLENTMRFVAAKSGRTIWSLEVRGIVYGIVCYDQCVLLQTQESLLGYYPADKPRVMCVDEKSGSVLWNVEGELGDVIGPRVYLVREEIHSQDSAKGGSLKSSVWTCRIDVGKPRLLTGPIKQLRRIDFVNGYAIVDADSLSCYSLKDSRYLWTWNRRKLDTLLEINRSSSANAGSFGEDVVMDIRRNNLSAVLKKNVLYSVLGNDCVAALDVNTGKLLGSYRLPGSIIIKIQAFDGTLFVTDVPRREIKGGYSPLIKRIRARLVAIRVP